MVNDARFGLARLNWITRRSTETRNVNQKCGITGVSVARRVGGRAGHINFTNSALEGFGELTQNRT